MTIKIKSDGNIFFSLVLMFLISFATRDYKFFLCGYERDARTIGEILNLIPRQEEIIFDNPVLYFLKQVLNSLFLCTMSKVLKKVKG